MLSNSAITVPCSVLCLPPLPFCYPHFPMLPTAPWFCLSRVSLLTATLTTPTGRERFVPIWLCAPARVDGQLEICGPLRAFNSRRIFIVCWGSDRDCYLVNVGCSSEAEVMLRLSSFCSNKLCPGTVNSACFSPMCGGAEMGPCSHLLPSCCSCTQRCRFHQIFHWFSTETF